jgi:hypothetical protein
MNKFTNSDFISVSSAARTNNKDFLPTTALRQRCDLLLSGALGEVGEADIWGAFSGLREGGCGVGEVISLNVWEITHLRFIRF